MKVRPASLRQFANGNVFEACDDAFLADSVLDESAILESKHHEFHLKDGIKNIILDKTAPDYEEMFLEKGEPLAADEILESLKPLALKIPLKARSEFQEGQLPLSELLMAIQYYASHLPIREYSMNESALLGFGMLVEQWADEMIDDNTARMFLEMEEDANDDDRYAPASDIEEEKIMENWALEESDSDVISVDLEESDTDEDNNISESVLLHSPRRMDGEARSGTKRKRNDTIVPRKRASSFTSALDLNSSSERSTTLSSSDESSETLSDYASC